jgi:hypothetical protein
MSSSISHLSINEQQATAVSAKRKKDDTAVMAQATTATAHREYEALVAAVATTRTTLDEARAYERATTLAWENEKTITRHLK